MFRAKALFFLAALTTAAQVTSIPSGVGGGTGTPAYSATVTSQTTLTVSAGTHGQGTAPIAFCFDNATPANAVACAYTRNASGTVVFTWSPSFSGTVVITSGSGGGAGATTACEIVIGDPGAATPILADDNDAPALCANVSGSTQTITAIACWANVGTPTVRPIITGGAANSLLSADLTCGTGSYATGTLNGTPTLANGATIDANIASAGGVAKYIVIRITRSN